MWEGKYRQWASGAEGGFLTPDEITAQWNKWKNDPNHPRDFDGPRGYLQLAVIGHSKDVINFQQLAQTNKIEMQQKLDNNITADELRQKVLEQQKQKHRNTANIKNRLLSAPAASTVVSLASTQ